LATRGKSDDGGPGPGRALLAALVIGGGLFAGIHWSDGAIALLADQKTHHVVELVPAEEVGKPAPHETAAGRGSPRADNDSDSGGGKPGETSNGWREKEADAGAGGERSRPAREIDRGPAEGRKIALTFDAGSSPKPVAPILAALRQRDLHCTFFLTGHWAEQNPATVRAIAGAGHELGNHTYSHANLTRLSDDGIATELRRAESAVRAACGHGTHPFFRPPLGARDDRVLRAAAREGYTTVYWSTDSLDSVTPGITPDAIRERVAQRAQPGSIVLLHCGSQATAKALPDLLDDLERDGYSVVTLSELLAGNTSGGG
jgi:peptidoglycan/xylan/chitin deacetylase (PgdA/CDA1 family)